MRIRNTDKKGRKTFHLVERLVRNILLALVLLLLPPGDQVLVCGHNDDTAPLHLLEGTRLAQLRILVHVRLRNTLAYRYPFSMSERREALSMPTGDT